ncbi:hypothetical protein, partial [Klebsiella pneumoniae]|uniref:hypothetical protein n=1 Tax=Klebsiella pneumoniae TaxID=573 RepID=UPI0022721FB6
AELARRSQSSLGMDCCRLVIPPAPIREAKIQQSPCTSRHVSATLRQVDGLYRQPGAALALALKAGEDRGGTKRFCAEERRGVFGVGKRPL